MNPAVQRIPHTILKVETKMHIEIRKMKNEDWADVCRIYQQGIMSGTATFQAELPSRVEWNQRHLEACRMVAVDEEGLVLGWIALGRYSSRYVYRGVAEVSIYVAEEHRSQGIGFTLLSSLIEESEKSGFWTLQAGIMEGNTSSYALHLKCGFREVGRREKLGRTAAGVWKDVILVERRSSLVGLD